MAGIWLDDHKLIIKIKKGKIALSAFLPQYFFNKGMETETT